MAPEAVFVVLNNQFDAHDGSFGQPKDGFIDKVEFSRLLDSLVSGENITPQDAWTLSAQYDLLAKDGKLDIAELQSFFMGGVAMAPPGFDFSGVAGQDGTLTKAEFSAYVDGEFQAGRMDSQMATFYSNLYDAFSVNGSMNAEQFNRWAILAIPNLQMQTSCRSNRGI